MISFVVPAHNEEALIESALRAIHAAAERLKQPYEIVVVDDASTDQTAALAAALGARVERVALRKISAVRNAGARVAHGSWLFFVDADTRVTPEAVSAAWSALQQGCVGGGATAVFEGRTPLWARVTVYAVMTFFRWVNWAPGCFIYCRREAFEAVGGFDETLYASEELSLSRAMKRQGRFRVLRERVITSGRKLRTHTAGEILGALARLAWQGEQGLRRRDLPDLRIWYGPRRPDP